MEFSSSFLKVLCQSLRHVTLIPFSIILCMNYGNSLVIVISIIKIKVKLFGTSFPFHWQAPVPGVFRFNEMLFCSSSPFFFLHIQHVFLSYKMITEYHNMKLSLTVGTISPPLSLLYRFSMTYNRNLAPHLTMAKSMHSHCA